MRVILFTLALFLSSCYGTYYISDTEYSNIKEEHTPITYWRDFDGCFFGTGLVDSPIYWGWSDGFYYYYGKPHYYPWYYYYNTLPPSIYSINTHIIINKPVNKPTYRPNKPTYKPNKPTHRPNIKSNKNKVIIHGSKRTNQTTIKRKPKK
jgi:hypothetical protein